MNEERWETAQDYERGFWSRVAAKIRRGATDNLEFYEWRSEDLVRRLKSLNRPDLAQWCTRSLEIGSGPIGVSSFFPASRRFAVDPLEDFYRQDPALTELREADVKYLPASGERLPFDDDQFNLVIIENCIDHTSSPDDVMSEIHRVLVPEGLVYLTVNCRSLWGYPIHKILSRLRIDAGHPHTYTPSRVRRELMEKQRFRTVQFEEGSFFEAWKEDLTADSIKQKLKGILGVSEFLVTVLAVPET